MDARLSQLEARLGELLAGGWDATASQRAALAAQAPELRAHGLSVLADRLDALAAASSAAEGLATLTLALRAVHLLRVRLSPDQPPAPAWKPIAPGPAPASRLLLLAPISPDDGKDLWACARLRDTEPASLLLLEPLPIPDGVAPWLGDRHLLRARLRWVGRQPAGPDAIDVFQAVDPEWLPTQGASDDPLADFRERLRRGQVADGGVFTRDALQLHLVKLRADARINYTWLSPSLRQTLGTPQVLKSGVVAVCWRNLHAEVPLARLNLNNF